MLICSIVSNKKNIYIFTIYSPPRPSSAPYTDASFWLDFLNIIGQWNNVILLGDFNAHALWNPSIKNTNIEGDKLSHVVESENFVCLNSGDSTWHSVDHSSQSILDLTFVSPDLAATATWNLIKDSCASDHYPILIKFLEINCLPYKVRPSYNIYNFDHQKFSVLCDSHLNPLWIKEPNVNQVYTSFLEHIHLCARNTGAVLKSSHSSSDRKLPP